MAKPFFSEREVRLARSFIKAIHGNEKNGYLLLAVIAWQRAMSKSHDTFWKSLTKYTAFRAGQLLAKKLALRSALDHKGYVGVIKSLRLSGTSANVARNFIAAIEASKWDRKHFGYVAHRDGHWLTRELPSGKKETIWVPEIKEQDPLLISWMKLTGHNIPKQYFVDKVYTPPPPIQPKPKPAPPQQPRSLVHVLPEPDYISPYGARVFYESRRHLGDNVLPE